MSISSNHLIDSYVTDASVIDSLIKSVPELKILGNEGVKLLLLQYKSQRQAELILPMNLEITQDQFLQRYRLNLLKLFKEFISDNRNIKELLAKYLEIDEILQTKPQYQKQRDQILQCFWSDLQKGNLNLRGEQNDPIQNYISNYLQYLSNSNKNQSNQNSKHMLIDINQISKNNISDQNILDINNMQLNYLSSQQGPNNTQGNHQNQVNQYVPNHQNILKSFNFNNNLDFTNSNNISNSITNSTNNKKNYVLQKKQIYDTIQEFLNKNIDLINDFALQPRLLIDMYDKIVIFNQQHVQFDEKGNKLYLQQIDYDPFNQDSTYLVLNFKFINEIPPKNLLKLDIHLQIKEKQTCFQLKKFMHESLMPAEFMQGIPNLQNILKEIHFLINKKINQL